MYVTAAILNIEDLPVKEGWFTL